MQSEMKYVVLVDFLYLYAKVREEQHHAAHVHYHQHFGEVWRAARWAKAIGEEGLSEYGGELRQLHGGDVWDHHD